MSTDSIDVKLLLGPCSDAQLAEELARREEEKEAAAVPEVGTGPFNSSHLINACKEHLACLRASGQRGGMSKEYVYRAAMEHVYGGGIHDWIEKHI